MSMPNLNKIMADAGFDRYGNRNPIPDDPQDEILNLPQRIQQPLEVPVLTVARDTVKAWSGGLRIKNGAGFFAAPPASQSPLKNSDYLRLFVDSSYTAGVQLGYGVLNLPMSDQLYINGTGDLPDYGENIVIFQGAKVTGKVGNMLMGGMTNFSGAIWLPLNESDIETVSAYKYRGMMYYNNTTGAVRIYKGTHAGGSWQNFGSGTMKVIQATRFNTAVDGTVNYAHGLGAVPTKVQVIARCYTGGALAMSDGAWDGTTSYGTYGSIGAAAVGNAGLIHIETTAGNYEYGNVSAVDATDITIDWGKLGTPAGTTFLTIQAWS